jgi:peptide/nickel transport system permease protein
VNLPAGVPHAGARKAAPWVDVLTTTESATELTSGRFRRGGSTLRFVAAKIGGGLTSLVMVVVLGFFLFRAMPGNPVRALTTDRPGDLAQVERLRREWSLDKPLPAQFGDYLVDLLHGDLGTSFKYRQPVTELIMGRIWATVLLTGTALVLSVALGLWLGSCTGT